MNAIAESYVIFELAGSYFGLPTDSVHHIDMFDHVTLVPNANPAIDGVVFSRGQVIPALNLRLRFGFPRGENTIRTRIVFAKIHNRTVGLIVDSAREFRRFSNETIRPIEETLTGISGKYLKSVARLGDRLILMLDLEAVLNVDEVQSPSSVPAAMTQNTSS